MEITLQDLKDLITPPLTTEITAEIGTTHPLIGQRVLTRTYTSGVSIGTLGSFHTEGGMVTLTLTNAVRIWRWEDAFTVSELATSGGKCRVAHHPDLITITEQGVEILPVDAAAWSDIQSRWEVGAK